MSTATVDKDLDHASPFGETMDTKVDQSLALDARVDTEVDQSSAFAEPWDKEVDHATRLTARVDTEVDHALGVAARVDTEVDHASGFAEGADKSFDQDLLLAARASRPDACMDKTVDQANDVTNWMDNSTDHRIIPDERCASPATGAIIVRSPAMVAGNSARDATGWSFAACWSSSNGAREVAACKPIADNRAHRPRISPLSA